MMFPLFVSEKIDCKSGLYRGGELLGDEGERRGDVYDRRCNWSVWCSIFGFINVCVCHQCVKTNNKLSQCVQFVESMCCALDMFFGCMCVF